MEQIDETQYDSNWQTKRCAATFSLCMIAPAVQYEITYEDSGVIISEQFERYLHWELCLLRSAHKGP